MRLRGFDYARDGAFFITICTDGRRFMLGDIIDGEFMPTDLGKTASWCWADIPDHFQNVIIDEFVVMPNHFHGILFIQHEAAGTACRAPTAEEFSKPVCDSLPTVVRSYKAAVTKSAHELGLCSGAVWQRGYYERVIRRESELYNTRKYIRDNPLGWDTDPENIEKVR
ncbi:MAG: transposase [Calditrichota bacterium]